MLFIVVLLIFAFALRRHLVISTYYCAYIIIYRQLLNVFFTGEEEDNDLFPDDCVKEKKVEGEEEGVNTLVAHEGEGEVGEQEGATGGGEEGGKEEGSGTQVPNKGEGEGEGGRVDEEEEEEEGKQKGITPMEVTTDPLSW